MSKENTDDLDYRDKEVAEILRPQSSGFDHRTEIRHPRTGEVIKRQDYSMTVTKTGAGNVRIYERDGKKFWEDNSHVSDKEIVESLGEGHELMKSRFSSLGEVFQKKNSERMKA